MKKTIINAITMLIASGIVYLMFSDVPIWIIPFGGALALLIGVPFIMGYVSLIVFVCDKIKKTKSPTSPN